MCTRRLLRRHSRRSASVLRGATKEQQGYATNLLPFSCHNRDVRRFEDDSGGDREHWIQGNVKMTIGAVEALCQWARETAASTVKTMGFRFERSDEEAAGIRY